MKITTYIKNNWETLPKSKFDDLELVMFHCVHESEEGWGHHSYEGFGVDKAGSCHWMFSSGCSCSGGPSERDMTHKNMIVNDGDILDTDCETVDFNNLKVTYNSYG